MDPRLLQYVTVSHGGLRATIGVLLEQGWNIALSYYFQPDCRAMVLQFIATSPWKQEFVGKHLASSNIIGRRIPSNPSDGHFIAEAFRGALIEIQPAKDAINSIRTAVAWEPITADTKLSDKMYITYDTTITDLIENPVNVSEPTELDLNGHLDASIKILKDRHVKRKVYHERKPAECFDFETSEIRAQSRTA